jgi:hypothetical protein
MAGKDFVQLIEQEPGMYDKLHADYDKQVKIYLTWERIVHEMKESGFRLSSFETILAPQFKLSCCINISFISHIFPS